MRFRELSNAALQRHIRAWAEDSSKVFITEHARDRMLERGVSDLEAIECLRRGVIERPPQTDRKTGDLKCRMDWFGASGHLGVVVALSDGLPEAIVVTVLTRKR
jgi:hypothetical protein